MDGSLRVAAAPSLREQVSARIREAIIGGRFVPGERLIERNLCELMGVSRTSVREALRELESEGLVTTVPNRGPIVSLVSVETARSIYEARAVLEGLAAELFAERATNAQIDALERATDQLQVVYDNYEAGGFLAAKQEFYRILLEGAGNEIVTGMLRSIHTRVSQLRATSLSNPERTRKSMAEIRKLVAALAARDGKGARRACIEHIQNAGAAALAVLERQNQI